MTRDLKSCSSGESGGIKMKLNIFDEITKLTQ